MQRDVLYRGMRIDKNVLVEGDLIHGVGRKTGKMYILPIKENLAYLEGCHSLDGYEVIPETVGEFTGISSENHKTTLSDKIFEDDIFRATKETDDGEDITSYLVVVWIKQLAAFYLVPVEHYSIIRDNDVSNEPEFAWLFDEALLCDFYLDSQLMRVGNIYDNPELLK